MLRKEVGPEIRKKLNLWQVIWFTVLYLKNLEHH